MYRINIRRSIPSRPSGSVSPAVLADDSSIISAILNRGGNKRIFLLPADRWMETDGFGARLRNDPIIMNTWLVHRWRARWSVV